MTGAPLLLPLLLVPLVAAVVLALVGDRKFAPEINILGSAVTFAAGLGLALQVYERGLLHGRGGVLLRRRLQHLPRGAHRVRVDDHGDLQPALHAARARARPGRPRRHALLPRDVPALHLRDAALPADEQRRHPLDRDGAGHPLDRAAGVALPHADRDRGGVEILHPLRRRHRAGALRHRAALLRGREGAGGGGRRAALDQPQPRQRPASSRRCSRWPSSS